MEKVLVLALMVFHTAMTRNKEREKEKNLGVCCHECYSDCLMSSSAYFTAVHFVHSGNGHFFFNN